MDITNAYAMIVNGGKKIKPKVILSVHDKTGKQIINNEVKKCINCNQKNKILDYNLPLIETNQKIILDPRIAFQITSMLEGVILRGTGKKIQFLNKKTSRRSKTFFFVFAFLSTNYIIRK